MWEHKSSAAVEKLRADFEKIMECEVLAEAFDCGKSFEQQLFRFRVERKAVYSINQDAIGEPTYKLIAQMIERGPAETNPFLKPEVIFEFRQRALEAAKKIVHDAN